MTMLGVCPASCRDEARGGAAQQSAEQGEAGSMAKLNPRRCFPGLAQERRTPLGLSLLLQGRLWMKIRPVAIVAMPQRKHSASRTSLRASKTSGLRLPLTREPPRRRRIERRSYH